MTEEILFVNVKRLWCASAIDPKLLTDIEVPPENANAGTLLFHCCLNGLRHSSIISGISCPCGVAYKNGDGKGRNTK
jgi:hypothetical protein